MCKHEIYLTILIASNIGFILGFVIRCGYDKEFRDLVKQMYKIIK